MAVVVFKGRAHSGIAKAGIFGQKLLLGGCGLAVFTFNVLQGADS